MMEEVSILILAGGKSQRMGQNKAFLKLNGVSFLEHIISVLRPLQSEIYISGSKKQYNSIELPIIEDHPDFKGQGPLAGILSGLMTIKSDWLFVISVDAPQISIEQVLELYKHTKANKMVLAKDEQFVHPLIGFYHKLMLEPIKQNLEQGKLSVKHLYSNEEKTAFIPLLGEKSLKNINTPEDYNNEFMEVKINFYGELAELIQAIDSLTIATNTTVGEFKSILTQRCPELDKKIYKMALNNAFITDETIIARHSKIDVFPPFAGG